MAKRQAVQTDIASADTLDLRDCSPEERERIEKALNRRDTVFSLHFHEDDIKKWKLTARKKKESLTDWVERNLNVATVAKPTASVPRVLKVDTSHLDPIRRKRVEKELNRRGAIFSLRLRRRDIESWKEAAAAS